MCLVGESESGHGGRFEPCEAYKRLEAENAALRQERDRLAGIVEKADALVHAVENDCHDCEESCCYCGFPKQQKAYREARHG